MSFARARVCLGEGGAPMISREYCVTMATYGAWMNQKLYSLCGSLPDAERTRERGAFFGSIQRTLHHLLLVDEMLLDHFVSDAPTYLLQSPDTPPVVRSRRY
jgi:uncharacterized damage-inducible protein DinB